MADEESGALQVEVVAADRVVWSGEAEMIIARTIEGDVGVLPGHAPMLAVLAPGATEVRGSGETTVVAVDGGFLSVADDRVSLLSERAELSDEIDVEQARADAERASGADDDDDEAQQAGRLAEARLRAVERAG